MKCIICGNAAKWVFQTPGATDQAYCEKDLPRGYRGSKELSPVEQEQETVVAQDDAQPEQEQAPEEELVDEPEQDEQEQVADDPQDVPAPAQPVTAPAQPEQPAEAAGEPVAKAPAKRRKVAHPVAHDGQVTGAQVPLPSSVPHA